MSDRTVIVGAQSFPVIGPELKAGDKAPDFLLQHKAEDGIKEVSLKDFAGKTLLLSVIPSLDTPVCAVQTKTFNQWVEELPDAYAVLTVSTDLPFGQSRFCGVEGITKVICGSDHRDVSFGKAYGVLIEGGPLDRFLSRALFVVDPAGIITYVEYVPKTGQAPDYDAVRAALGA